MASEIEQLRFWVSTGQNIAMPTKRAKALLDEIEDLMQRHDQLISELAKERDNNLIGAHPRGGVLGPFQGRYPGIITFGNM